jgi:hypothetical protein
VNGFVNVAHAGGVVMQRHGWPVTRTWGVAFDGRNFWNVIHLPTGRVVDALDEHSQCGIIGCRALCLLTGDAIATARMLALGCDTAGGQFGGDPVFPPDGLRRCQRMLHMVTADIMCGANVGVLAAYPPEPEPDAAPPRVDDPESYC